MGGGGGGGVCRMGEVVRGGRGSHAICQGATGDDRGGVIDGEGKARIWQSLEPVFLQMYAQTVFIDT